MQVAWADRDPGLNKDRTTMVKQRHQQYSILLLTALVMSLPGLAAAFDHLEITVMNPVIVDGYPSVSVEESFDVQVRAVNGDGSTDTAADYIHAYLDSPDVAAGLPGAAYLVNGEIVFSGVTFLGSGKPVRLRVADQDDGSVPFADVLINCYDVVDHFVFDIPAADKYVGTSFDLTIHAQDSGNNDVRNFRDDVVLTPSIGHFTAGPTITVPGASFTAGVAVVGVVLQGTDGALHQNTINAENTVTYSGQVSAPTGDALVSPLYPGALARMVLVMPGETLSPGESPGKTGASVAQISGFAFNDIDVYATDQYWNPVMAGPYPSLAWSSDDLDGGVVLPAGGPMASNVELDQSAVLVTSGLRQVTVTASGALNASTSALVQVNPDGLDHFEFDYAVFDTLDVQATTSPFTIRVWAKDSFGNDFPYNGPVSMSARIGGTDESADYVITSTNTFVNGRLDALVQVTKRAFSVKLVIDSNTGIVVQSGDFQVNSGPLDRVLITWPGEIWTPGLNTPGFSGNMGVPNPAVAGAVIGPVELRTVDAYANLVSGTWVVSIDSPNGYLYLLDDMGIIVPDYHITLSGTGSYQVVYRTAGEQFLSADVGGIDTSFSSALSVSPNIFKRIIAVAPGETLDPGTFDTDGKLGTPVAQDAGVPFDTQVYATDYFANPISNSSGYLPMDVSFESSDPAATLPAGPQTMLSNVASFQTTLVTLDNPNLQTLQVTHDGGIFFGTTIVPIVAGVLDHFDIGMNTNTNADVGDPLEDIPDHQAGSWLPSVTVIARDAFGNHISAFQDSVTLSLNLGGDVLTPTRVSMRDGFGSGLVWGVWRNTIRATRAGSDVTLIATDDIYGRTGTSNTFDVFAGPYESLQMLLPGETSTPGESPGKYGVPLPVVAGDSVPVTLAALDAWWNPVSDQPLVHLESDNHFEMISDNDVPLEIDGVSNFDVFFKTATTHTLKAWELSNPAHIDSSDVDVDPGAFYRLMAVAPGETPDPGGPESDGKIGLPAAQTATLQFPLVVQGVDSFWNRVDVSSDRIRLLSDDGSIVEGNPLNNGQTLSHGEIVFPVGLNEVGYTELTVLNETDPTILGQDLTIQVQQGAQYRITQPDTAVAGPPSTFVTTIELVDEFGVVMTNANHDVTIRALTPTLQDADGSVLVTSTALVAGSVVVAAQAYDRVEQVVFEISDSSGRLGYSPIIQFVSGGLEYQVTVDESAPVTGPPAVFPVTVTLIDTSTGHQVDDDRFFSIGILDEAGDPALGMLGTVQQRLVEGSVTFDQSYTRAENIRVQVWDDAGITAQSGVVTVGPADYARLQILAPGEVSEPGIAAYDENGKSGAPAQQRAGESFPLTVRAVDQHWNRIDTFSDGRIHFEATDDAFAWADNPSQTDVPFVNGERVVDAFLVATGSAGVTVTDLDAPGVPAQTVHVPTQEPYAFEIDAPATAQTGGVPGFSLTVRLVDPDTGALITDAYDRIHLEAFQADYSAGTGVLGLTEAWLVAGVAVINDESYSALEDIVVRVYDEVGRTAYSELIHMETGGLYYQVTAPETATVGGPSSFPLEIELIDSNTGERVSSHNSLVSISVFAAGSGLPGEGVLGVIQQMVGGGYATVEQTYTLAEEIYFQVEDAEGNSGVGNSCSMIPDGFKQLQIVAPGETPDPGAESNTGKTGDPAVQIAGEPFDVEIRAVDQFWNPVTTLNAGALEMVCDPVGGFEWQNPGDYHAPFVNGRLVVGVILDAEGNMTLLADDLQTPGADEGQVVIPVVEAVYAVTVPDTAYVGPPATFPIGIQLLNPGTGEVVPSGARVTIEALGSDFQPASGLLTVDGWTLLLGQAEITTQSYGYSEQIVVRVSDDRGRSAFSELMAVVPMGVTYALTVPDTVVAGEPWPMDVSRVDVVTGRTVTGYDTNFTITAMNAASGEERPLVGATPAGVLGFTYGVTLDGLSPIASQTYDRAELIRLRVVDDEGGNVLSQPVYVRSASADAYTLTLRESDGADVDRVLRPLDRVHAHVHALDASGNPAPDAVVSFSIVEGDVLLGAARAESMTVTTDGDGLADIEIRVEEFGNDDLLLETVVDELEPRQMANPVAGPPTTEADFSGVADPYRDGWYVSFDSLIELAAVVEIQGEGTTIYFDVDGADGPMPATPYTGPFSLEQLGVTGPGEHELRYFAEEDSGIREAVRTVLLYTTQAVTLAQEITNRPNPFAAGRELTRVLFNPTASGTANITIYDLYGAVVLTHHMDVMAHMTAEYTWDGKNGTGNVVANGGYICRITGPGYDYRRKIAVVK